jgi:3-oxoacyl-[acyl-carrier protein] reductase
MSDYLVKLGRSGMARRVVSMLNVPLPLPEDLQRDQGPWRERDLLGMSAVLGGASDLGLEHILTSAGVDWVHGTAANASEASVSALVFDARGIVGVEGLRKVYDFFHPRIRGLKRSGRVLVLGTMPLSMQDPEEAAAASGLEGFVRSLAKELGRKGSTANLLYVAEGADEHLAGPVRFFLSKRSAFVTGQPIEVMTGLDAPDVSWHQPLAGQVALVTGAARGIGAATARRLAAEGAQVVCLDRPADERLLQAVVDEIKGFSLALDVTDDKTPEAMVSFLQQRFGGVDVVIHNAGITRDKTLARMKPSWWDVTMDVNLNAIMKMQRALESSGCLRDGGRVVCLSSIAGIAGNVGQTNYAASKSGLAGYVRHRAPDLLDRQTAISAVAPGFIETRLTEAIPFVTREGARRLSSLGQGGLPEDVAELLTFLATPAAMGLSGNVIRICGGNLVGA